MTKRQTMMRVRSTTKLRLRRIARQNRWSIAEAADIASRKLEADPKPQSPPAAVSTA